MASVSDQIGAAAAADAPVIRPKTSRDEWIMCGYLMVIALYLIATLVLPLYAMVSKSFEDYGFRLETFEIQVDKGEGWSQAETVAAINERVGAYQPADLVTSAGGRLPVTKLFPDFSFRSPTNYRIRNVAPTDTGFLVSSDLVVHADWVELTSNKFRRVVLKPAVSTGLSNYRQYFATPALFSSIQNSILIATISTIITVTLAFLFAYALNRSCMRFKGTFRLIAMAPILVPSLLPGIALVYLFGNQGMIKELLLGYSIYGPIGIVIGLRVLHVPARAHHHPDRAERYPTPGSMRRRPRSGRVPGARSGRSRSRARATG